MEAFGQWQYFIDWSQILLSNPLPSLDFQVSRISIVTLNNMEKKKEVAQGLALMLD